MKIIYILILFQLGCASLKSKEKPLFKAHPLAMLQGSSSEKEVFITVLSHKTSKSLKYFYTDVEKENLIEVESFFKKLSPDKKRVVEHLNIKNLSEKKFYKIIVKRGDKIIDERSFRSLNTKKDKVRLGVLSCTDDQNKAANEMWQSYLNKFVDVSFFIGDNVYADYVDGKKAPIADKDQLWLRYLQTFDRLYVYHSSALTPTYVVWDDHDYGKNDGGSEYIHKKDSLSVFNTFFPRNEIEGVYKKTMGSGSILKAFGQEFLFIDNRFFRDEGDLKGQHWGGVQTSLVLENLKKAKRPSWLIQGDQFFGSYHPFESFEKNHPFEFSKTLKKIKKTKAKVLFISGDRHLTEIMKIEKQKLGYPTYEITSSGMHAKVFPGSFDKHPNPRQLVGKSGVYNYTVFEINQNKNNVYNVISYGKKNWVHYSKKIEL